MEDPSSLSTIILAKVRKKQFLTFSVSQKVSAADNCIFTSDRLSRGIGSSNYMNMIRTLSKSRTNWPAGPGPLRGVKRPSKLNPEDKESLRESKIFRSMS